MLYGLIAATGGALVCSCTKVWNNAIKRVVAVFITGELLHTPPQLKPIWKNLEKEKCDFSCPVLLPFHLIPVLVYRLDLQSLTAAAGCLCIHCVPWGMVAQEPRRLKLQCLLTMWRIEQLQQTA